MDLKKDVIINGDLTLSQGVMDLAGKTLTINGDFIHKGGVLNVSNGKIVIKGNYQMCDYIKDSKGFIKMTDSSGAIDMSNNNGRIVVGKDFIYKPTGDWVEGHNNNFYAGTLEVKGNFIQKNSDKNKRTDFYGKGTFKFLLSGTGKQTISFEDPVTVNDLEITNNKQGNRVVF